MLILLLALGLVASAQAVPVPGYYFAGATVFPFDAAPNVGLTIGYARPDWIISLSMLNPGYVDGVYGVTGMGLLGATEKSYLGVGATLFARLNNATMYQFSWSATLAYAWRFSGLDLIVIGFIPVWVPPNAPLFGMRVGLGLTMKLPF